MFQLLRVILNKLKMLGTMDGKDADPPSVTVIHQEAARSGDEKKSRVTRKHVMIAVTSVVVVAMVITGILVGVKFYLDGVNQIVKRTYEFKNENKEKVKEDVSADVKENYVRYHVKNDDSEVWVIDDFNRQLELMKVKRSEGSKCYVATLNSSDSALPDAVLNSTATDDAVQTDDKYYSVAETEIKDHSMLGTHGQELCENLDVYWMTQTCEADTSKELSANSGREKREASHRLCLRRHCWYCYKRCRRIFWWRRCKWYRCCSCYAAHCHGDHQKQ